MKNGCLLIVFVFVSVFAVSAQKNLTVYPDRIGAVVQHTMWGVFFEDINFGADGGIYAELVKNRSFEFYTPLMGWKIINKGAAGEVRIINRSDEMPSNPRYARIIFKSDTGWYGLSNAGFRGIGITKGTGYNFSVIARKIRGNNIKMTVQLVDSSGNVAGSTEISDFTDNWNKYNSSFISSVSDPHARLNILMSGDGTIDLDMISLFPQNTWKNRNNGFRADLVQMLADLKPGFLRFPGGCIVEGHDLTVRYQWKKTVGPVEDRELIVNRWNTEFMYRHTPDYFQSFGLGFYEYFLLAEDLGAEPLPILNCGMACQFNTGELVPLDQLDPYIQDALDLIEFANGQADTGWGKLRADMGHPRPFNLKYFGVGNEQWGQQYIERYKIFAEAIKSKYPDLKLVSAAGPSPDGERFDYLWKELKKLDADLIDEHYYQKPEWFLENACRYDNYDREGPKVFAGEYASHGPSNEDPTSRNTWLSALTEAAFMTGLERNADVVYMTSYAPLFGNVNAWQWRPDLIWFDNLRIMGTPNYYVQKMFSTNRGTNIVPLLCDGKVVAGEDSLYASAVIDKQTGELILKMVNVASKPVQLKIKLQRKSTGRGNASLEILESTDLLSYNTPDDPLKIFPENKKIDFTGSNIALSLDPRSLNVLKVKYHNRK